MPESVKCVDWMRMMQWAEQQAVVGVIYGGIQRAGKTLDIPFGDLMEWIGYAQQIEAQNRLMNKKCVEVVSEYQRAGFNCMLLKGQGNAKTWSSPLLRNPGDIDILITDKRRKEIVQYVKRRKSLTGYHFHHIEYEEDNVPVEIHFFACSLNNPVYRNRLNNWLAKKSECILVQIPNEAKSIPVPTWEYNAVFQLAHMMHHFFDEGIGLRQFVDYYYLLKSAEPARKTDLNKTLQYLNLYNFAGAVMYVLEEALGMEERYLLVPADERRGKTLLKEVLKGGNFGQHSGLTNHSIGTKHFLKIWRNLHFVREYPAEALCEPFFRTWHFFWRLVHR